MKTIYFTKSPFKYKLNCNYLNSLAKKHSILLIIEINLLEALIH